MAVCLHDNQESANQFPGGQIAFNDISFKFKSLLQVEIYDENISIITYHNYFCLSL